jgi:hypothetical protein
MAQDHTCMPEPMMTAIIGVSVETIWGHYQGHCMNRWRDTNDHEQSNALKELSKTILEIIK